MTHIKLIKINSQKGIEWVGPDTSDDMYMKKLSRSDKTSLHIT